MADLKRGISLYAVRMRVARLAPSGAPLVGADNMYVTDSLVRVDYEPQFDTADPKQKTNGRGSYCLNVPGRTQFQNSTMTVEVCDDDPALTELLAAGAVLVDGPGGDIIGYQGVKSTDPENPGVSVEVWTQAFAGSGLVSDLPYRHYVFPKAVLHSNARSLSADVDELSFDGIASENPSWGNGPANDWGYDSTAYMQWVGVTEADLPAVTNGYAPIAADVPTP